MTKECPVCGDSFSSQNSVRAHVSDNHKGICHICEDSFEDKDELYKHLLVVHEDEITKQTKSLAKDNVSTLSFRDVRSHSGVGTAIKEKAVTRRRVLGSLAAGGVAVAGGGAIQFTRSSSSSDSLSEHPSTDGIEKQPVLGSPVSEADNVIVAFEDPSCPSCAQFKLRVFPRLKKKYIESGNLSFVFRGYPVVYPWGQEAVRILESVYNRNIEAFRDLKTLYYESQSSIDSSNVIEKSRKLMSSIDRDINVDAVISDLDNKNIEEAVQTDVSAGRKSGVTGTPTFHLFSDATHQTKIVGTQRLSVFENALGL